jgi:hypothetical protein
MKKPYRSMTAVHPEPAVHACAGSGCVGAAARSAWSCRGGRQCCTCFLCFGNDLSAEVHVGGVVFKHFNQSCALEHVDAHGGDEGLLLRLFLCAAQNCCVHLQHMSQPSPSCLMFLYSTCFRNNVWICVDMYGYVWICMDMCGYVWICV